MFAAYREPDRAQGHELMVKLNESIISDVPQVLTEIRTLGRTLNKRAADALSPTSSAPAPATA